METNITTTTKISSYIQLPRYRPTRPHYRDDDGDDDDDIFITVQLVHIIVMMMMIWVI